jgi:predicted ABC-type exoprotein transport system permease subunit
MLTRLLILVVPNHPFRKCDMSLASWEKRGTELFRFYAYVLDIVIVSVVIVAFLELSYRYLNLIQGLVTDHASLIVCIVVTLVAALYAAIISWSIL